MATIKISNLNQITPLNPNTGNVSFVATDTQSGVTGRITATTLASGLFANNVLNVGNTQISFPNVVAQFAKEGESYIQVNLLNTANGGSADYVATAESGTDTTYFIDTGYANKNFVPGSEYNSLGDAIHALDGYLYVQGNSSAVNVGGNLVIGTTTTGSHVRLIAGGGTSENVIAELGGTYIGVNRTLVFGDGTTQNTSFGGAAVAANTPSHVANSAAVYANGAFLAANTPSHVANSAALYANGAFSEANSAFTKANNALANTSGTFAGDLSITGNLNLLNGSMSSAGNMTVNGTMVLANSNFSPTESALTITASPTVATPSNDGYMIHISGKNGIPSRIVTDSYGANSYVVFAGRAARGNVAYPSALQANDVIARFSSNGYGTTKYQPLGVGRIDFVASQNFTDANTGSRIEFYNCPVGSNTLNKIATFNGDSVEFAGAVKPDKGFIYTPRILSGAQTAITIDFANDSMVRATFNSTLTISLSNYVYGKVVEVWLTNTAGNGQTINLGALANNVTTGSSTLTVAAGRSAKLQYFSINGDQANTFLAVTYA